MRLPPFNGEPGCQCSHFLCVPVAGRPDSGARGCAAAARGPVPLAQPDDGTVQRQMAMLGLSGRLQRWHGDGTEVFRLAALTQASPSAVSSRNYRPSRRSHNSHSAPENVQENTGPSSWQSAHRFQLKEDPDAFSQHLLETVDSRCCRSLKKQ